MSQSLEHFNKIYAEYRLLVYNLALHYANNIEDAEEITQNAFVKIYFKLQNFEHKSELKTWIYRITINESLDFLRKKKAKKYFFNYLPKSPDQKELERASNFEHPGILLERQEDARILFEAINTLAENQKTAFLLSKVELLSNPEIAEIMQTSVSAVESLVFRAKSTLREKLKEKFKEYRKNN